MPGRGLLVGCVVASVLSWANLAGAQQSQVTGVDLKLMRDPRIEGRRALIVGRDFFYCYPPTNELIVVPRGYVTDFASVPPAAKVLIDEFGSQAEAAIVHDWLYAVGEPGQRLKADRIFRFAMKERGVDGFTRSLAYRAVRTGGGGAYGREGEWATRFGDPELGMLVDPWLAKPPSGVVATLDTCEDMEDLARLSALRAAHDSSRWPRVN